MAFNEPHSNYRLLSDNSELLCKRYNIAFDSTPKEPRLPRLKDYFATSESEAKELLRKIELAELDLAFYDLELSEIRNALQDKRKRLQQHKEDLQSLKSAIRKLPTELLQEIFTLVCDSPARIGGDRPCQVYALDLASTCSFWRTLVLSQPRLWSSIHVYLGFGVNEASRRSLTNLLRLYLRRSGSAPLTLAVQDITTTTTHVDQEGRQSVLRMLLEQYPRWYRVSLTIERHLAKYAESLMPRTGFPELEFLELRHYVHGSFSEIIEVVENLRAFEDSPKLHTISLPSRHPTLYYMPFTQLVSVTFAEIMFDDDPFNLINICPVLKCFTVKKYIGAAGLVEDVKFTSSSLTTLNLGFMSYTNLSSLFRALFLPSLAFLRLSADIWDDNPSSHDWPNASLLAMVVLCSESLQSLSLQNIDVTPDELLELLSTTLRLNQLFVSVPFKSKCNPYTIMSILASGTAAPRLTNFNLEMSMISWWNSIGQMIKDTAELVERRCLCSLDVQDGRTVCLKEISLVVKVPQRDKLIPISDAAQLIEGLSRDGVGVSVRVRT